MKHPLPRSAAAALGGLTVLAVAAAVTIGLAGVRPIPQSASWAIPLVAGAAVGLMSLFLLAGVSHDDEPGDRRVVAKCASCGEEVLEDWRLCPHCGVSNGPMPCDGEVPGAPTNIEG